MKTTLGVALTPPSAAALIAGACLLAAACLPTCHGRDYARASAAAPAASPCAATAKPARAIAADALDEAAEAAQAARYPPGAAQMQGHAASGQR
ncbi:hypothetical protein [Lysobacter enzymogenes]|uniref:hypothetical protein n=1 Tax=Lysobacter enzymogenes TaxID=69 RepID=UPI001AF974EA|nr:hypothetical protein [Lysobacter enzymogenes]QQQ03161.1 hypothetical protein JHW41_09470 [Lysobacter enzymogenes]